MKPVEQIVHMYVPLALWMQELHPKLQILVVCERTWQVPFAYKTFPTAQEVQRFRLLELQAKQADEQDLH